MTIFLQMESINTALLVNGRSHFNWFDVDMCDMHHTCTPQHYETSPDVAIKMDNSTCITNT